MDKMAAEPISARVAVSSSASLFGLPHKTSRIRASQPINDKNNYYKQLGMFALRKKIEESILSAEILAPIAIELEEAKRIKQEELIRKCNLWDDLAQANEVLVKLAESDKAVDALKDLRYKAEEAKLIMELAEMDAINDELFKQRWVEQLVRMYIKWAEKQGHKWRIIEKFRSKNGGIRSATIEFESRFVYGYLMGERGIHCMIRTSREGSVSSEASLATVDVIPLFLESAADIFIDDKDTVVSFSLSDKEDHSRAGPSVHIEHIPTGFTVKSTGERNRFANKMKALNRLKAKLLTIMENQRISRVQDINRDVIVDLWSQETRRYVFSPSKLVQDVKTGIQLPDLTSVLNGNIEPLIAAHISNRRSCDVI